MAIAVILCVRADLGAQEGRYQPTALLLGSSQDHVAEESPGPLVGRLNGGREVAARFIAVAGEGNGVDGAIER